MKRTLVILTVAVIAIFTGGLACYLFGVGVLLRRIATNLEESADTVRKIDDHAKLIGPGVGHINQTGGVVAGALPLLYGMAEQIVAGVAPQPNGHQPSGPGQPDPGGRRSRLRDVGFDSETS
ncbi:MAG TPA: hypothetical protein VGI58_19355 [Streptosporangiaceae bacterium]